MTIAQALAALRTKWPKAAICVGTTFWEHNPKELQVSWSVWVGERNTVFAFKQASTLQVAVEEVLQPPDNPETAAEIVQQAVESIV